MAKEKKAKYTNIEVEKTSESAGEAFYNFFGSNGFFGCYSTLSERIYLEEEGCSMKEWADVNLFLQSLGGTPAKKGKSH